MTLEATFVGGPHDGKVMKLPDYTRKYFIVVANETLEIPLRETSAGYRLFWNEGKFL